MKLFNQTQNRYTERDTDNRHYYNINNNNNSPDVRLIDNFPSPFLIEYAISELLPKSRSLALAANTNDPTATSSRSVTLNCDWLNRGQLSLTSSTTTTRYAFEVRPSLSLAVMVR